MIAKGEDKERGGEADLWKASLLRRCLKFKRLRWEIKDWRAEKRASAKENFRAKSPEHETFDNGDRWGQCVGNRKKECSSPKGGWQEEVVELVCC